MMGLLRAVPRAPGSTHRGIGLWGYGGGDGEMCGSKLEEEADLTSI